MRIPSPTRRTLLVAAALAIGGCSAVGPRPAPADYRPVAAADTSAAAAWDDSSLLALGLPPLRSHALPAGQRELRLLPSSGPATVPELLVRVVDRGGAGSTAEWIAFWPGELWEEADAHQKQEFRRRMRDERGCGPIASRQGTEFCHLAVVTGPRAAALVARLDSVGAWPLPDPRPPPAPPGMVHIQLDGQGLVAEARDGRGYQARHFGQREMRLDSAVAYLYRFAWTGGGAAR